MDTKSITPALQTILDKFSNAVDEAAGQAKAEMWKELKRVTDMEKAVEQLKVKSRGEAVAEAQFRLYHPYCREDVKHFSFGMWGLFPSDRQPSGSNQDKRLAEVRKELAALIDSEIARERERIAVEMEKRGATASAVMVRRGE